MPGKTMKLKRRTSVRRVTEVTPPAEEDLPHLTPLSAPPPTAVIDDWIATSTVTTLGRTRPRSPALQRVDDAVAALVQEREFGPVAALAAVSRVGKALWDWRVTKDADHESIRSIAVGQLEAALDSVFAGFFRPRSGAMRRVGATEKLPTGTVWVHGTDAIGEIFSSGEVWGGTGATKIQGTDQRAEAALARQEQHFFMVKTGSSGVVKDPGNAFIKGRQAAEDKLRRQEPLKSWETAGRPLLGVIEFHYDPASDDSGSDGIRRVQTGAPDANGLSVLPLAPLRPLAVRVATEEDAVRLLEYVRANGGLANLPPVIRVLADPARLADKDLLTGDPARYAAALAMLGNNSDFRKLMTEAPARWRNYDTAKVLVALPPVPG